MAGNSSPRGARRKTAKKGPTVGSGGRGRRALEGKGPTPKAEDRTYHPAYKRKLAAERAQTSSGGKTSGRGGGRGGGVPRGRRGEGTEFVAGRNSAVEALRAGIPVTALHIASRIETDDRVREILATVTKARLPVLEVGKPELDRITGGAVHQGIALQVPPYTYSHPADLLERADGVPLIVALDQITDPHNLGAVLRSAGAFGATGVMIPERRAAGVTASAWKVSAGAAARVPVARATNFARALAEYAAAGLFLVGLDADGTVPIGEVELLSEPLVLVVGSEGKGLSRLAREACDVVASIPMASTTESLNASVAAAISLYEVAKRRAVG